jgi:large conductance mechanosensitive channel
VTESPPPEKKSLMQEFFDFLKTFGVIGLAIAFIISAAASNLITALVTDIINPFVGLFLPAGDLQAMQATSQARPAQFPNSSTEIWYPT